MTFASAFQFHVCLKCEIPSKDLLHDCENRWIVCSSISSHLMAAMWGQLQMTRLSSSPGCSAEKVQEMAPPQSWPTWCRYLLSYIYTLTSLYNIHLLDVHSKKFLDIFLVYCCAHQGEGGDPQVLHQLSDVLHILLQTRYQLYNRALLDICTSVFRTAASATKILHT